MLEKNITGILIQYVYAKTIFYKFSIFNTQK